MEVLNPRVSESNFLADFSDGTAFRSHPMFSVNPHALQIFAYYDDVEVVNPLGAYTKTHKLGCLFFFLGNVRPQFRSTLKTIHLLAVGRSIDIQTYGMNVFLTPFVKDLKQLYCNGITINVNGESKTIHCALLAFFG